MGRVVRMGVVRGRVWLRELFAVILGGLHSRRIVSLPIPSDIFQVALLTERLGICDNGACITSVRGTEGVVDCYE
jgi:hypothetical protein